MKKFISAILCALLFVGSVLPVTAQGIVRVNPDVLTMEHFRYRQADLLVDEGKYAEAAIAFGKLGDYSDARQRSFELWKTVPNRRTISFDTVATDYGYMFCALRKDGTVAVDAQESTRVPQSFIENYYTVKFKDIVSLYPYVGLKMDGTLVLAEDVKLEHGEELARWTDIVSLCVYGNNYLGLKADGTVVAAGSAKFDVAAWKDISAVAQGEGFAVGLKSDGTLVLQDTTNGDHNLDDCLGWTDIVDVSAEDSQIFGLKKDGTVVAVGWDRNGTITHARKQKNVANLDGRFAIKKDGTISGFSWTDVAQIAYASSMASVDINALRKDGIILVGRGRDGSYARTATWLDIQVPSVTEESLGKLRSKAKTYEDAEKLFAAGKLPEAAIAFAKLGNYSDARQRSMEIWDVIAKRKTFSACFGQTLAMGQDGKVYAAGVNESGQGDVSAWTDVIAVAAGTTHSVGLKAEGTVVAAGNNYNGANRYVGCCNVGDWENIVDIGAAQCVTVGLKNDGTVVAVGDNTEGQLNVFGWTDIIDIDVGQGMTIGLKTDGTVVIAGDWVDSVQVSDWKDVIAVGASNSHVAALKSDGTVVAAGWNNKMINAVAQWTDIVQIEVGDFYIIGVKIDGTVVGTGLEAKGLQSATYWRPRASSMWQTGRTSLP